MLDWRKTTVAHRLRWLRSERYGERGQSAFARELAVSPSRYNNYEKAVCNVPLAVLRKVQARVGCDLIWLLDGHGQPFASPGIAEGAAAYRKRAAIPILGSASAADPRNRVAYDNSEGQTGEDVLPEGLHEIKVIGDSMVPLALDGQYIIICMSPPGDGDLAVVEIAGEHELFFKRVQLEGKTHVHLLSINPDPRFAKVRTVTRSAIRRWRKVWGIRL